MEKVASILMVVDRESEGRQVLNKAIVLARHFGAALELFLCDSEHAYILRHAYNAEGVDRARRACLEDARTYLESLRRSVQADDIRITTHAACESPLYQAIVQRVLETSPDLVIKNAAGGQSSSRCVLDANDWQLARTCPVPLMLTRGRPWQPRPRFAAAVDVSEQETAGMARAILQTSDWLATGCQAELEVLYSERGGDEGDKTARASELLRTAGEFHVDARHVHVLEGEPEQTLPQFAISRGYDVLVLGALSHRKGLSPLVGTLTSRLVDAIDCDFVLVKPSAYSCPLAARGLHSGNEVRQ